MFRRTKIADVKLATNLFELCEKKCAFESQMTESDALNYVTSKFQHF